MKDIKNEKEEKRPPEKRPYLMLGQNNISSNLTQINFIKVNANYYMGGIRTSKSGKNQGLPPFYLVPDLYENGLNAVAAEGESNGLQ